MRRKSGCRSEASRRAPCRSRRRSPSTSRGRDRSARTRRDESSRSRDLHPAGALATGATLAAQNTQLASTSGRARRRGSSSAEAHARATAVEPLARHRHALQVPNGHVLQFCQKARSDGTSQVRHVVVATKHRTALHGHRPACRRHRGFCTLLVWYAQRARFWARRRPSQNVS